MDGQRTFNIGPNFNLDFFVQRLAQVYAGKGYSVNTTKMGEMYTVSFEKNAGGIYMLTGLTEGIKANISCANNILTISFFDAEWNSKIIAAVIGWFLFWIPLVTAIIGFLNQTELPKKIGNDAGMIISSFR